MLQSFSDRIKNSRWLGYVIVGVISVPFALWGIQSYVGGGGTNEAAEVNGEPIPVYQVQRIASQQRQRLRQQLGGSLPSGLDERLFMERALEQLIEREVLRQAVADAGFRVTDETLRRNIRQQPMFRREGQFDPELYRRLLSQAGLSPQQYEADVRAGYRIEQLRRGITDSGFVTIDEARRMARLQRQERDLAVLVHPRAAASAAVSLDEEALRAYYEQNGDAFQRPAQVRAAYLELDMAALRAQVEIDEETLRAEYRANQDRYGGQEERRAAHILLEVDAQSGSDAEQEVLRTARELRERLAEGAEFETLAREHSDDPGSAGQGGDLGYVSRGSMVEAFEQALFSLEEGAVSEPVRSPYGYHLIKLLDVRATQPRPFAEVRDELERKLRDRRAERLFYDRVEVLRNSTYEQPGSLEPAAEATGLEIRHTDWFSRGSGDGIASDPAVREAAFSPEVREERLNSDLVELGQRRVVVLRVDEERPAQPRPFAEVRAQVEQGLRAERAQQRLRDWVQWTLDRLDQGAPPAELATGPVQLREPGWVDRNAEGVAAPIRQAAFELPLPAGGASTHGTATLESGDRAVVIVRAARLPEVDAATVTEVRRQRRQAVAAAEFTAWVAALRAEAEIVRNAQALSR